MPRNVEGEFELVLGNKQLLSLFFLVVVLFAVFFSLGYMVGKSICPASTSASQQSAPVPAPASDRPPASSGASPTTPSGPAAPPPTETQPARGEPVAVSTAPAVPVEPPKEEARRPSPVANDGGTQDSGVMVARELHLQLAAVRVKDDAEVLVATLRKKGYPVVLHTQARDGWYRVLVGPFSNERAARDTKVQLEKDGYKSILKKP